jgi:short-subunit dehydrogenase
MNLNGAWALITGASAGIGREFAGQLARRGCSLVLVARRRERLEDLRDELQNHNPGLNVHVRVIDLADKSQIDELIHWLEENKIDIGLLINNAGLGDIGPFATSDPSRNEQMILVNVLALTSLTRKLLPHMILRKNAAIVNVSSSAGFLPFPEFNVYAATKAYVTSFSEALNAELRGTGVSVTALCPGPVETEFQMLARRPDGNPDSAPEFVYVSVEKVVRDAIAAVEAHRPLIIPGFIMKLGIFLTRLTPMPILRLIWRLKQTAPEID